MKKLRKLLKNKRGESYIDVAVGVLIICIVLAGTLNIFQFITLRIRMDRICEDLIEAANYSGCFGSEFYSLVDAIKESEFDFEVSVDGEWFNEAEKKVQLGNTMQVTITVHSSLMGLDTVLPIDATVSRSGLSEKYWKAGG